MTTETKQVRNLQSYKSNKLVNTSYSLTLNERRLIELSIALVDEECDIPDMIVVAAEQYGKVFNVGMKGVYRELSIATKNLYKQSIRIIDEIGVEDTRWVDRVKYLDGNGTVEISFSKWVKPYLKKLRNEYTYYGLLEIGRMTSSNTIRLYELLMQFKKSGMLRKSLSDFRLLLGVGDKYPSFTELNRRIITPAIKQINKVTNYNVRLTVIKRGRSVATLEFAIIDKD